MKAVSGAGQLRQLPPPGKVVGLNVGIDDVLDFHTLRLREFEIGFDVSGLWVHDRGPRFSCSTEHICSAARVVIKILSKDHGFCSLAIYRFVAPQTEE